MCVTFGFPCKKYQCFLILQKQYEVAPIIAENNLIYKMFDNQSKNILQQQEDIVNIKSAENEQK